MGPRCAVLQCVVCVLCHVLGTQRRHRHEGGTGSPALTPRGMALPLTVGVAGRLALPVTREPRGLCGVWPAHPAVHGRRVRSPCGEDLGFQPSASAASKREERGRGVRRAPSLKPGPCGGAFSWHGPHPLRPGSRLSRRGSPEFPEAPVLSGVSGFLASAVTKVTESLFTLQQQFPQISCFARNLCVPPAPLFSFSVEPAAHVLCCKSQTHPVFAGSVTVPSPGDTRRAGAGVQVPLPGGPLLLQPRTSPSCSRILVGKGGFDAKGGGVARRRLPHVPEGPRWWRGGAPPRLRGSPPRPGLRRGN